VSVSPCWPEGGARNALCVGMALRCPVPRKTSVVPLTVNRCSVPHTAQHSAFLGMEVLVARPEGERSLGRSKCRWKHKNNKLDSYYQLLSHTHGWLFRVLVSRLNRVFQPNMAIIRSVYTCEVVALVRLCFRSPILSRYSSFLVVKLFVNCR
jgi:hypothetical protein